MHQVAGETDEHPQARLLSMKSGKVCRAADCPVHKNTTSRTFQGIANGYWLFACPYNHYFSALPWRAPFPKHKER